MFARWAPDACLRAGSDGGARSSPAAVAHLRAIPTIALDYPIVESAVPPTVRFTTAVYGVHCPGTSYRMDESPIPLRAFLATHYPTDSEVLESIRNYIVEKGMYVLSTGAG